MEKIIPKKVLPIPGPWRVKRLKYHLGIVAIDMDKLRVVTVANVPNVCTNATDTDRANADMMAAAPDLYEACIKAHNHLCSDFDPNDKPIMDILLAAIGKAEGNPPDA